MKTAQSCQKSYADKRRRPLEFEVGDKACLKTSPVRGITRFRKRGKLGPRYIGPFEILDKVGKVAYRLALPPAMAAIHDVFHVSILRKYIADPAHILNYPVVEITKDLKHEVHPEKILDRSIEKQPRNKTIPLVKIQWKGHTVDEAMWERESEIRDRYPAFF